MNLFKRILPVFVMIFLSTCLNSSTVFIEGSAEGRILFVYNQYAYLGLQASGVPNDNLLAIDLLKKKILWEVKTNGAIYSVVHASKEKLITIEEDILISRESADGKIIWKIKLNNIYTDKSDSTEVISEPNLSWLNKKMYNKCINNPKDVKWFKYTYLLADLKNLILFRVGWIHYDQIPFQKDWIKIDLDSGQITEKGCYALGGFNNTAALITDYKYLYRLDNENLKKIETDQHEILKELVSPNHRYYFDGSCVSSDWFFMYKQTFGKDVIVSRLKGNCFRKFSIKSNYVYWSDIFAIDENILQVPTGRRYGKENHGWDFWLELYDLEGNSVKSFREANKKYHQTYYLGQTGNGDLLFLKDGILARYSMPDFELISTLKMTDSIKLSSHHGIHQKNEFVLSEMNMQTIFGYPLGNIFQTNMKKKKAKRMIGFKFYYLESGEPIYELNREVSYFKRTKK